jgi:EAL domain-containing protein (putative c-di-GMP-specific phosphodiesterase class I)
MADDLCAAIASDELEVHYQVQWDVADGGICGFEALARWPREWRASSPAEFIPIAEEYGLIERLGEGVLRWACAEASTWLPPHKVAVNLTPLQLKQSGLSKDNRYRVAGDGVGVASARTRTH